MEGPQNLLLFAFLLTAHGPGQYVFSQNSSSSLTESTNLSTDFSVSSDSTTPVLDNSLLSESIAFTVSADSTTPVPDNSESIAFTVSAESTTPVPDNSESIAFTVSADSTTPVPDNSESIAFTVSAESTTPIPDNSESIAFTVSADSTTPVPDNSESIAFTVSADSTTPVPDNSESIAFTISTESTTLVLDNSESIVFTVSTESTSPVLDNSLLSESTAFTVSADSTTSVFDNTLPTESITSSVTEDGNTSSVSEPATSAFAFSSGIESITPTSGVFSDSTIIADTFSTSETVTPSTSLVLQESTSYLDDLQTSITNDVSTLASLSSSDHLSSATSLLSSFTESSAATDSTYSSPVTTVVESSTSVVESSTTVVKSSTTVVESSTTVVESSTTVVESSTTVVESSTTVISSITVADSSSVISDSSTTASGGSSSVSILTSPISTSSSATSISPSAVSTHSKPYNSTTGTSPGVSTELTTSPMQSPSYPTMKPDIEKAIFDFEFTIAGNSDSFSKAWANMYPEVYNVFGGMRGFTAVVADRFSRRRRRVRRANYPEKLRARFFAKELTSDQEQKTVVQNLTDACSSLDTVLKNYSYVLDENDYNQQVAKFAEVIKDQCNSNVKDGSLCGPQFYCQKGACLYKCEGHHCGANGVCYLPNLEDTVTAKCLCHSDNTYDYSGDRCQHSSLKLEWVAGIVGGVCGLVIVILLLVICCVLKFFSKLRRSKAPADDRSEFGNYLPLAYRLSNHSGYTTAFDNAVYQPTYPGEFTLAPTDPDESITYHYHEPSGSSTERESRRQKRDDYAHLVTLEESRQKREDYAHLVISESRGVRSPFAIQRPRVSP